MQQREFRAGEQLWLRGERVVFVEYHRYADRRIGAAIVRRGNETTTRVVPLRKLSRARAESIARQNAIPATLNPGRGGRGRCLPTAPDITHTTPGFAQLEQWARLDSDTPANRSFLGRGVAPGSAPFEHVRSRKQRFERDLAAVAEHVRVRVGCDRELLLTDVSSIASASASGSSTHNACRVLVVEARNLTLRCGSS